MKYRKWLTCSLFLFGVITNSFAGTERYCNAIGDLAKGYVGDRNYGQAYQVTLQSAADALAAAKIPADEKRKYMRDMNTVVRWVYKDFPQLSPEGAYKLIHLACIRDELE